MSLFAGQYGPEPFLDATGRPIIDLVVELRAAGDPDLAPLYADRARAIPLANPVPAGVAAGAAGLDVKSNLLFYAEPGSYDMVASIADVVLYESRIVVAVDPAEALAALELVDGGPW